METNNHQINDYSSVLERKYGKKGTPERARFDEEAYTFYTSQIIAGARKEMKMTQSELARATGIRSQTINELYHDFAERVSLDELDLICEALDCELDDLIVREPNPERRVKEVRHIPQTVNKSRKK